MPSHNWRVFNGANIVDVWIEFSYLDIMTSTMLNELNIVVAMPYREKKNSP